MADQVQIRRNTTAGFGSFAAAVGELIMDTTKNALYIGNGLTTPGIPVTGGVPQSPAGASAYMGWCESQVTLAGATTAFTLTFPTNIISGIMFAIASRIDTAPTGSGLTGFEIGWPLNSGTANQFITFSRLAIGTSSGGGINPVGVYYGMPAFTITPVGAASFTGGNLHISALVLFVSPPTS